MEIILFGLVPVVLFAILILLLKHLWLMCSKLLEAAWQAAILAMIIFPLMVITGRPGLQEEDATTTKPNVESILVGADI